ncbi:MAG: hypothetical protein HYX40_12760 [Sphingobacteriales bacterium]|nr:hypothetical protein [Sphingobacteriales bacterium]
MKKLLTSIFALQTLFVLAQGGPGDYDATKNFSQGYGVIGLNASGMLESYDASGKRIPGNNQTMLGTKMLSEAFVPGVVKFTGQQNAVSLLINFSLLNNQLFFKKDSLLLAFVNPIEEFALVLKENGINKSIQFKNGYPATGVNTDKTFYQVLSQGEKIHLLKYVYKIVQEKWSYNGPAAREYAYREKFYLYDVTNKTMNEIHLSAKSISKSVPSLSYSVENFSARNKIKTEDDLKDWVATVNDVTPKKK